ncbi:MarR family winged helix-turn-helix transcriptional regulator [Streptomyces sp. BH106]|uniref:MarR family winged helix-turn-helix transcriptional regulator n=1 Tax=Streptomyces sp. BH106 TaxID=3410409 RepID=UPI003CFABD14
MPVSGREADPVEIGLRYLTLGHDLRKVVDDAMTAGGLSLARTKVLQVLERRGALGQSALARELGQAPRSVTQSVEALEREGLVERTPAPTDARSKLVRLTPQGTEALAAGTAAGERVLRQVFGAMEPGRLRDLAQILGELQAGVSGASGGR